MTVWIFSAPTVRGGSSIGAPGQLFGDLLLQPWPTPTSWIMTCWSVGGQMTLQAQMMLHSSKLNEDPAWYSCNLEKCVLCTKNENSNSNFVLMQLTMFIIDSCFCLLNYPICGEPQTKIIIFRVPWGGSLLYEQVQSSAAAAQKRALWSWALLLQRGREGHGGFIFSLGWGLERYGWTMSVVGGKWASTLIAWSVAGWLNEKAVQSEDRSSERIPRSNTIKAN